MLLFLRPSNGLSIVFIRPFKGLFELCLWFPASLTGTNLFCFEANKWTQLKLEPALFLSLHSRTNCVFQRPSHGLIIAFTHKMRIFLRPSHGLIIVFTHKMRIFLSSTNGLKCSLKNLLFKLSSKVYLT